MNTKSIHDKQTEIFDKYGVFFAFSQKQYNEAIVKGVEYISLGGGMIAPKNNADKVINELSLAHNNYVQDRLKNEGKKKIIHYELANHEAQIDYDIDNTVDAVEIYGITRDEVQAEWKEYLAYCIKHDLF